jgi:ribosome-associated heat shock protein Hsp15
MRHNDAYGRQTETYLPRPWAKTASRTTRARSETAYPEARNGVFSNSVSPRYAGLLIPRSQVRSLPGPFMDQVRVDKWLWAARFFKTRGLATTAVVGGRVHVNGERAKPSKLVHVGDVLEVTRGTERWTVAVTQVAEKRGPASVAQEMYSESADSRARREQQTLERRLASTPGADLGARPTKQARRRLDSLRRGQRRR